MSLLELFKIADSATPWESIKLICQMKVLWVGRKKEFDWRWRKKIYTKSWWKFSWSFPFSLWIKLLLIPLNINSQRDYFWHIFIEGTEKFLFSFAPKKKTSTSWGENKQSVNAQEGMKVFSHQNHFKLQLNMCRLLDRLTMFIQCQDNQSCSRVSRCRLF